jgi:hypothetical protein
MSPLFKSLLHKLCAHLMRRQDNKLPEILFEPIVNLEYYPAGILSILRYALNETLGGFATGHYYNAQQENS